MSLAQKRRRSILSFQRVFLQKVATILSRIDPFPDWLENNHVRFVALEKSRSLNCRKTGSDYTVLIELLLLLLVIESFPLNSFHDHE